MFPENDYPSSHIKELKNRVAFLETQVGTSQPSQTRDHLVADGSHVIAVVSDGGTSSHINATSLNHAAPNLVSSVGLLSLHAGADPQYFGVSSGVSLARMLEIAVHENARPYSLSVPAEMADSPFSDNSSEARPKTASLPSAENGSSFIDAYLSYIQPSFPFISQTRLWAIHRNRRDLEEIATDEARHNFVLIQLIYAIGSRCLQLIGSANVIGIDPDGYYNSAMTKIEDDLSIGSIQTIQTALLVAIYALRSPSSMFRELGGSRCAWLMSSIGSSVWDLCGLMIRQCLQLGFHKQLKTDEKSSDQDEFKKRLFWSTYHLERRISLVLGRPLAINDDEIDVDFPHHIEEDSGNHRSKHQENSHGNQRLNSTNPSEISSTAGRTDISFHVLVLMLDQLNSKSRLTLCRLAKAISVAKPERKIAKRFQKLEEWKIAIFGPTVGEDTAKDSAELMYFTSRTPVQTPQSQPVMPETQRLTLLLNYHRARRLILQTILTDIHRPNQVFPFSSFAKSSGEVCQLNRRLHRLKPVPFTLLDLHSVFVAGLSMIYCVWKDPQLYDAEMAADFGACSTVLYLIAEQWGASAKKYRDAFELGAERTAEYIQSIKRSRKGEEQQPVFAGQQGQVGGATYEDVIGDDMQNQSNTYDTETTSADGWSNDNFDVWQMINRVVQTHDTRLEQDTLGFTGIDEFMAEDAMWWFNEGTYTGTSSLYQKIV